MADERQPEFDPAGAGDDEEIEIVEVVGVDDEGPAERGAERAEEVEVRFEDGARPGAAEARALQEQLLRLRADFENLKKRVAREREDYFRHATSSLVARLLPVLDNLERALASAEGGEMGRAFLDGLRLIHRQLLEELRREGLRAVEAVGRPFDPHQHEAVEAETAGDAPPNTVVAELLRGYWLGDRLLRPAAVRVRVAPEPARPEESCG